jgi:DNA polymerase III delta prime subunit
VLLPASREFSATCILDDLSMDLPSAAAKDLEALPREQLHRLVRQLEENMERVVLGKPDVVRWCLVAMLAGEHVLLEDVPGVGKTLVAKALARSVAGDFCRLQFTPDLLPSDILGSSVFDSRQGQFTFHRGPIFANIVLADEINRAPPRTQSALLEAMSEGQISTDGQTLPLPRQRPSMAEHATRLHPSALARLRAVQSQTFSLAWAFSLQSVHIAAEHRDGWCMFRVVDNGIGIEPEYSDICQQLIGVLPVKRVDEHMPFRRGNQPGRDPANSNVVDIIEGFVRFDLLQDSILKELRELPLFAEFGPCSHQRS